MPEIWSLVEVEALVADYFTMLKKELHGDRYNKSEHRRALRGILPKRSDTSIEKKHQNVSAVLIAARFPYIQGYKPLSNYQGLLRDVVLDYLEDDQILGELARRYVEAPAASAPPSDLLSRMTSPPADLLELARIALGDHERVRRARKVDYLEIEARNRILGVAGECFVLEYEKARLFHAGFSHLAEKVEHVSQTRGDGMGFDVLSFHTNGRERYIEVKTTRMGPATPFYLSANEVDFSETHQDRFSLYRVFTYDYDPRVFALNGSVRNSCELRTTQFLGSPRLDSQQRYEEDERR